jgi:hypothetical protein
VWWAAIDLDDKEATGAVRDSVARLREAARRAGLEPLIELSSGGHGFHVWFFLAEATPCALVHAAMQSLCHEAGVTNTEGLDVIHPRAQAGEKGFGGGMALPLAASLMPQGRTAFVDENLRPQPLGECLAALLDAPRVTRQQLEAIVSDQGGRAQEPSPAEARASSTAVAPPTNDAETVEKRDPFFICSHKVHAKGTGDSGPHRGRHPSLVSLAGALAAAGVLRRTASELVCAANMRNAVPPLPNEEVVKLVEDIFAKEKAKKKKFRSPAKAVVALVKSTFSVEEYVSGVTVIHATVNATGEEVEVSLKSVQSAQASLMHVLGDLGTFAKRARGKGTAAMVLAALRDRVPNVAPAEAANRLDEEGLAEQLVHSLVYGVVVARPARAGELGHRTNFASEPGDYIGDGIRAVRMNASGRAGPVVAMAINLNAAVTTVLRDHPAFGRGRRSVGELARLLKRSRYYLGPYRGTGCRTARYHKIDVTGLLGEPPEPSGGTLEPSHDSSSVPPAELAG